LDKLFTEKLSLKKPKYPIAFGRISRGAHFFVMFPPKRAAFNFTNSVSSNRIAPETKPLVHEKSLNLINFDDIEDGYDRNAARKKSLDAFSSSSSSQSIGKTSLRNEENVLDTPSPSVEFWLASKIITTEHLVAILAISNSFMNLQSFIDLQIKKEYDINILI
jgi:hypothetical protein